MLPLIIVPRKGKSSNHTEWPLKCWPREDTIYPAILEARKTNTKEETLRKMPAWRGLPCACLT